MYIVGELNDQNMAQTILDDLKDREILGHYFYNQELNSYVIAVEKEENVAIALDIYRVRLGLKKPVTIDEEWVKIKSVPRGQLTFKIVIFCIIIYFFSFFNIGSGLYSLFQIDSGNQGFLIDITHGQVWRILTPIFLHMSIMHILFNMLWFNDLGNLLEFKFNSNFLIKFIILSGIFSNLLQYIFKGPSFGGMSGVLYGMLGFIWIHKKLTPDFEYSLPKHDLYLMIAWFFLCLFGVFPDVANFAHAGGLIVGIWWAVFTKFELNLKRIKLFALGVFILIITILVEKFGIYIHY